MLRKMTKKHLAAALSFLLLMFLAIGSSDSNSEDDSKSSETVEESNDIELNARIQSNNEVIVVTNNDDFDYTNVKVSINSKLFEDGYAMHTNIAAGEKKILNISDFTNKDSQRFNTTTHAIKTVSLFLKFDDGKYGFY